MGSVKVAHLQVSEWTWLWNYSLLSSKNTYKNRDYGHPNQDKTCITLIQNFCIEIVDKGVLSAGLWGWLGEGANDNTHNFLLFQALEMSGP